jgi:hypothetical protein
LKKGRILPETELSLIFSTLPVLVTINKALLDDLQARLAVWQNLDDSAICIGDVLLHHVDLLLLLHHLSSLHFWEILFF